MAAPAVRGKISKSRQSRSTLARTFQIKKPQAQIGKHKLEAIKAELRSKQGIVVECKIPEPVCKKRRHESDDTSEEEVTTTSRKVRKARLSILPTPPTSSDEREILPETLSELIALHKAFVQALGVHYAHNGTSSTVPLCAILPAITRLWKRREACVQDVQRMLALWEDTSNASGKELDHTKGPFRLISAGFGTTQQINLERTASESSHFDQKQLHNDYERLANTLYTKAQSARDCYSFIFETLLHFPKLRCVVGRCTQAAQTKVDAIRQQILGNSPITDNNESVFSKLNISDSSEAPKAQRLDERLKSRTLGLFDRLKAKQLANSASAAAPTSAELVRRRALHRIPDIIDVLRLKQSQKLNNLFRSDLHGSSSATRTTKTKVSFSLEQLVQEIRDSGRVPIAPEEIRECLQILGREVPDTWCSVYAGSGLKCVTLQGEGWTKEAVKEWCTKELARINA